MNPQDRLKVVMQWPGNEDLDLYLYNDGADLLNDSGWLDREFSASLNPEILEYTANANGNYFVRSDLYGSTPTGYYITIYINDVEILSDQDTVIRK